MTHKIYYLLIFWLLLITAYTKMRLNAANVDSDNKKTLSSYQTLNKTYGSIEEALDSLDALPQRERIRFTDTKAEFVHEFIWVFDLVTDPTKGICRVENLRPLYALVPNRDINNKPAYPKAIRTFFRKLSNNQVMTSDNSPLYERALPELGIPMADDREAIHELTRQYGWYISALIGAKVAEKTPDEDKPTKQSKYKITCWEGEMNGDFIITNHPKVMSRFRKRCISKGGCTETCRARLYMAPAPLLDRYKISDEELVRFKELLEAANTLYEKNYYGNDFREDKGKILPAFEAIQKQVWSLDAEYSRSDVKKAIRVE